MKIKTEANLVARIVEAEHKLILALLDYCIAQKLDHKEARYAIALACDHIQRGVLQEVSNEKA